MKLILKFSQGKCLGSRISLDSSPGHSLRSLMPHQKTALQKFIGRPYLSLFLEMRLGKSLIAIRWAKSKNPKLILIASPNSALPDWEKELILEGIDPSHIHYLQGKEMSKFRSLVEKASNPMWCLSTHEMLRYYPEFVYAPWNVCICDESTKLKNPQSKLTKMFIDMDHIPYRGILSGRPNPESEMDYFCQFRFLFGDFMGEKNYWNYRDENFFLGSSEYEWIPKKGVRFKIREFVRSTSYVLTRKECNVGSIKIRERHYLDLPANLRKKYNDIIHTWEYMDMTTKYAPVVLGWLRRVLGGFGPDKKFLNDFRIKELYNLWRGNLSSQKIVVWYYYNDELLKSYEYFKFRNTKVEFITGGTIRKKRKEIQSRFNDGDTEVLLCQVKCVKFGVNLSGADTAIYYDSPFSLEERVQSEDRIIHAGKRIPVLLIDMIVRNSVDEEIYELLQEKKLKSSMTLHLISEKLRSLCNKGVIS